MSEVNHEHFMREAIEMAKLALATDETPVGCVFVRNGEIIGKGMNDTNRSLNGTRHAEFIALGDILSKYTPRVLSETDLQYRIRSVYFGCYNERFGGTGGALSVHNGPGVEESYPVYGGILREEAIMLLRRFYVQENEKAPEPKQKKTRILKTDIVPLEIEPEI